MAHDDRGLVRQRATTLVAPLRIRHFRRLWLADIVSLLGDWAGRLALAVLVLDRTGSPAWAAAVTWPGSSASDRCLPPSPTATAGSA